MAVTSPDMVLGLSPCPNDTFIFHALLHGLVPSPCHFRPHMADVEELNALALRGELPVTKISVGVLPHIMDTYAVLSAGSALGWWWPAKPCRRKRSARPGWPCRAL